MTSRILSIAGSDSGGGAGIQADIKTASAFGVYASTAITAVTAQNTRVVTDVLAMPADLVRAQIAAVLSDIGADAIKIGMLANAAICHAVADALDAFEGPVVLDPVMLATSGAALLDDDAIDCLTSRLIARTDVLTPNLPEYEALAGDTPPEAAAKAWGLALVLKDGHGSAQVVRDQLFIGDDVHVFENDRLDSRNTHGTGCTLSTAIACGLADGTSVPQAVKIGCDFVHSAILTAPNLGQGHGPLNFLRS